MNEDDLRAAFARHEAEAPDVEELHTTINTEAARRRRRRGTMLTAGAAAGIALAVGLPIYLTEPARPAVPATASSSGRKESPADRRELNLLLLGSDHRGGWEAGNARSDTIMIVHIPADRQKVYLISIERDVRLPIPGHGIDKVNSAFFYGMRDTGGPEGGLDLAERTIAQLSGVTFDGGAVVEYAALRGITDTLGGVPVCLPKDLPLYLGSVARPRKVLKAGCQTLNGDDAQALLQQRYGLPNSSYDRDRNAQRFMVGVAERAADLSLVRDAGKILQLTRTSGLTIRLRGLSAADLALQLGDLDAADVVALSLSDTFYGDSRGQAIPAQGQALLKALREGSLAQFVQAHPEMALEH